ncbi:MAG: ArsR/SmtB family transcription factor [Sphingomicrobium sp.]|nr:metalloregulator ArsR/SmtB family transcription factor [Sphingomonadales bacterium]
MTISPVAEPAQLFAALGDPHRLELVRRLASGEPRPIAALGTGMAISRQGLTKHLRTLERAGIVRSTRSGREMRFAIERERLADAERFLATVARQWGEALERLSDHLASD